MSKSRLSQQMKKLVREYYQSGKSKKDFATSHGVSLSKLSYWITKLLKPDKSLSLAKESSFTPIAIPSSPSREADPVIIIRLANGVEIEIPV